MIGITDRKLNDIAIAVGTNNEIVMNLGFALGFQKVSLDKYIASNHQNGIVSPAGTRDMLFDWKRDTRPRQQLSKLRKALVEAKLAEIAEELTEKVSKTLGTQTLLPISKPSVGDNRDHSQLQYFLCLKCDRITGKKSDVINTKRSDGAKRSKVRNIMGRECLVQLMGAGYTKPIEVKRFDVITLNTADVRLDDEVYPTPSFEGFKKHIPTWCKGCSEQVGWYFLPTDGKSSPFHALWLQRLIHDPYDSDNSLNAFFAQSRIEAND